ncbi:MAG: HlyD family efflux transporter periplasmic adaptor subunit [Phycisphaerae bacterium]
MLRVSFWLLLAMALFGAGLLAGRALYLTGEHDEDEEPGKGKHAASAPASQPEAESSAEAKISLDAEAIERIGLKTQALAAATLPPQALAYGQLEADPALTFTLRAPLPGTLLAAPDHTWPALGDRLPDGLHVADLAARLSSVERADLAARLSTARAEVAEDRAALDAARASYESKRRLNEQGRIVSDRATEEALAKMRSNEARLHAAQETVSLIESALSATAGPAGPAPLVVPRGGEVIEVAAQPGESVDAGQTLLRVARFDRLMARVSVPAGEGVTAMPAAATVVVLAEPQTTCVARPVAVAAATNSAASGRGFILAMDHPAAELRPGLAVQAFLDLPGPASDGVILPASAIVRHAGGTSVYVELEKGEFARRAVSLDRAAPGGWLSTRGAQAGDRVVTTGAALLLGQELKGQFQSGAGEEEE